MGHWSCGNSLLKWSCLLGNCWILHEYNAPNLWIDKAELLSSHEFLIWGWYAPFLLKLHKRLIWKQGMNYEVLRAESRVIVWYTNGMAISLPWTLRERGKLVHRAALFVLDLWSCFLLELCFLGTLGGSVCVSFGFPVCLRTENLNPTF